MTTPFPTTVEEAHRFIEEGENPHTSTYIDTDIHSADATDAAAMTIDGKITLKQLRGIVFLMEEHEKEQMAKPLDIRTENFVTIPGGWGDPGITPPVVSDKTPQEQIAELQETLRVRDVKTTNDFVVVLLEFAENVKQMKIEAESNKPA